MCDTALCKHHYVIYVYLCINILKTKKLNKPKLIEKHKDNIILTKCKKHDLDE